MRTFVLKYEAGYIHVCFEEFRIENMIIYEGKAFTLGKQKEECTEKNYTLSFKFTCDPMNWDKEKNVEIETPFKSVVDISRKLGTDILISIEKIMARTN